MKSIAPLLFVLLIINSCSQSKKQENYETIRLEVEKRMDAYANSVKLVNVDSTLSYWSDDLKLYRPTGEISGKEEFRGILTSLYQGLKVNQLKVTSREIDIADRIVIEVGEYSENITINGTEPQDVSGKYVAIWEKETLDVPWKIKKMITLPYGEDDIHN